MTHTVLQLRRDIAPNWATNNPVLAVGEMGLDINAKLLKLGDGVTPWVSLPYYGAAADFYFDHQQPAASATWTINHNLGARPNVKVCTVGGAEVLAQVVHTSANQALVYFDGPLAGFAICS